MAVALCASPLALARELPNFVARGPEVAPKFLSATQASAALAAAGGAPIARSIATDDEGRARGYLRGVAPLYGMRPADVDALAVHDRQTLVGGAAIVRFRNEVDGFEVFREELNVLTDTRGGLVAIGGSASAAPPAARRLESDLPITQESAVAIALSEHGFARSVAQDLSRVRDEGGYTFLALPDSARADDGASLASLAAPARAKRVWYRLGTRLVAAWYVEVQVRDTASARGLDAYGYVISAEDGALLFRKNQTADAAFTYRVYAEPAPSYLPLPGPGGRGGFPHPTGTPNGYQPPLSPGNLVTLQSAPFSRNDPWLAPGANRTIGNNVEAFTNAVAPDGFGTPGTDECNLTLPVDGDLHACVTSAATFDHVYNFGIAPNASRTQISAVVTNLFYTINYLHDWFYDAGFDEKARNAQVSNYGRGGAQNDNIYAEAQDYTGTDNATMSTPADGARPRMRMFLWSSSLSLVKAVSPPAIAGVKTSNTAEFGPQAFDLTGPLVLAQDAADIDGPTTTDGCSPYANAATVAGKIAFVDRGVCTFVVKARNAQSAGAVAIVIANNVAPGAPGMAGTDATVTIPVISVSLADGTAIKAELAKPAAVTARLARLAEQPRDGALDNTVIAHEWGHYLSDRLVANASGIAANQARGLGEGWSDFVAMLLLVKEADRNLPANADFGGAYPITPYPVGGGDFAPDVVNNAYYYGLRRYPYSRDMGKNPLTFRHIGDGVPLPASPAPSPDGASALNSEVHNTGEVWASMLWECYSNLLNDTGRLSFAQAQDRMKRYLVAGLKVTPVDPTFVQARDALLAVMQAQDQQDQALCLAGFAKRGLGVGAVAPPSQSEDNTGAVESFRTAADPGAKAVAVEFYHQGFDHYFITWVAAEIASLDSGLTKGWARTGQTFNVYVDAPPGTAPVCRIYIPPGKGDGHFFGRDANECAGTMSKNPTFILESPDFFHLIPPSAGNCAAGTVPVYRVFSNRADANHRYTTSRATRDLMVTRGWLAEGDGPDMVVMCAPT
ncbi:MAG: M36 family metallopeptidase [Burkholderiales bacterium]|nr:M36 family metallopeptidase [Burkholderiales bacterium]